MICSFHLPSGQAEVENTGQQIDVRLFEQAAKEELEQRQRENAKLRKAAAEGTGSSGISEGFRSMSLGR